MITPQTIKSWYAQGYRVRSDIFGYEGHVMFGDMGLTTGYKICICPFETTRDIQKIKFIDYIDEYVTVEFCENIITLGE